ncbi:MAG: superoxide dismutase family protein [Phycisphaerae bacterium]
MNIRLLAVPALALALTACANKMHDADQQGMQNHDMSQMNHDMSGSGAMMHHENMWESVNSAVAVLYPTKGNSASGTITFSKNPNGGLHIHGTITGLDPNSTHAFHIHEFGDASSTDGMSAGGHYNPEHHPHGGPNSPQHHAGDLGNVTADASGSATVDLDDPDLSIAGLKDPIIGRAVVLHAKPDDLVSQPVGNAGGRIAVGVIGIAKSK